MTIRHINDDIILVFPRMKPLGDRITAILYAHMLSVIKQQKVLLISQFNEQDKINKMIPFGDVQIDAKGGDIRALGNSITNRHLLWHFCKISPEFPNTISTYDFEQYVKNKPKLPKKFITTQWDAQQKFRQISGERIKQVEKYYKDQGCAIVHLEGDYVKSLPLEDIWYILKRAEYHVGTDSGMMHMARLVLPPERLHIYAELKDRDDGRTPDNKNLNLQARELIRRGAKLNPIDNLDKSIIEYYSDPDIFIGYKKEDYVKPSN